MTNTSSTVATRPTGDVDVFARLRGQVGPVARILDDEDTARRFIQLMLSEIPKTPRLAECTQESIVGALMRCAQFQLEPGPQQHVYLIPRYNKKVGALEANWELGYRGMIELASRVGIQIAADVVKTNDSWRYWRLPDRDHFEHAPALTDRGDTIRSYAVARFPDGRPPLVHISDLDEIHAARARSERPDKAWKTDFDAMAMKTPVKRLFKWIGAAALLRQATAADGTAHRVPVDPAGANRVAALAGEPVHTPAAIGAGGQDDQGAAELEDAPELHDLTAGQHTQLNEWNVDDDLRHTLAYHASGTRTTSSKALTKSEQDAFMTLARAFGADALQVTGDPARPDTTALEVNGVEVDVRDVMEAAHGNATQPPLPQEPPA